MSDLSRKIRLTPLPSLPITMASGTRVSISEIESGALRPIRDKQEGSRAAFLQVIWAQGSVLLAWIEQLTLPRRVTTLVLSSCDPRNPMVVVLARPPALEETQGRGDDGKGSGMKAIVQDVYGSTDTLRLADIEIPVIGDGEVLVRVRAAGVDPGVWHLMTGLPYLVRLMGMGVRRPKVPVRGPRPLPVSSRPWVAA